MLAPFYPKKKKKSLALFFWGKKLKKLQCRMGPNPTPRRLPAMHDSLDKFALGKPSLGFLFFNTKTVFCTHP